MKKSVEFWIALVICLLIGLAFPPLGILLLVVAILCFIFWGGIFSLVGIGAAAAIHYENKKAEEKDASSEEQGS